MSRYTYNSLRIYFIVTSLREMSAVCNEMASLHLAAHNFRLLGDRESISSNSGIGLRLLRVAANFPSDDCLDVGESLAFGSRWRLRWRLYWPSLWL